MHFQLTFPERDQASFYTRSHQGTAQLRCCFHLSITNLRLMSPKLHLPVVPLSLCLVTAALGCPVTRQYTGARPGCLGPVISSPSSQLTPSNVLFSMCIFLNLHILSCCILYDAWVLLFLTMSPVAHDDISCIFS